MCRIFLKVSCVQKALSTLSGILYITFLADLIETLKSTSSHSTEDSFQRLASEKFGEVKYEIIRSSQLLSPLLTKEQQNEARLDRKFEEIINAAKASKSIGRMFSDGTVETLATPDSTFSTLDKNSNFGTHKRFFFE